MEAAAAAGRKRKVGLGELQVDRSSVQLKTRRLDVVAPKNSASAANSGESTCESVSSDQVLASCCSSNRSKGNSKRESTAPVESESGELESTTDTPSKSNLRRRTMAERVPSEAELEEFFAAAESNIHKQFTHKYNYDIVKDEPLEGRYEWVPIQLKPSS
ncbi:hypothetical protein BUALT_Bualt16G0034800 [Buddleja alternifolia]|uniref:Cyclin-dependent kinase inhibitor domain-containing protein n=1 Tax=Buddleja alternifolia TaxID=168488 RepID=A0AAV6WAJ1_9LAMI|nr:hypothetical protein BUALT_Bualt16G0034800 [Buddleja alternifolia]